MTLQVSTGFKVAILGPSSFSDIFDFGAIHVYSGQQPATADDAVVGTLIGTVTTGGLPWSPQAHSSGIRLSQSGPYIVKFPWDNWLLQVAATGIASWARLVGKGEDNGVLSYDLPRIDMGVSDLVNDNPGLLIPSAALTQGQTVAISSFMYTIPPVL